MTPRRKMSCLKRAFAVAALLAMTGTASAKNQSSGGVSGDLSPDRTSATVTVTAQCNSTTQGVSGALSVYIFQPSGRLLNIGIGNVTVNCTAPAISQDVVVTVNAVPGLSFKPGPATLLIRFTTTDQTTMEPIVSESGSRVDLHP
jgi:hypothetical protein